MKGIIEFHKCVTFYWEPLNSDWVHFPATPRFLTSDGYRFNSVNGLNTAHFQVSTTVADTHCQDVVDKMVSRSLYEIGCDVLISEAKKRTSLYNFHSKEYKDKKLKKELWNEVREAVVGDWHIFLPGEKNGTGWLLSKQIAKCSIITKMRRLIWCEVT